MRLLIGEVTAVVGGEGFALVDEDGQPLFQILPGDSPRSILVQNEYGVALLVSPCSEFAVEVLAGRPKAVDGQENG